jgi:hypothetical protein
VLELRAACSSVDAILRHADALEGWRRTRAVGWAQGVPWSGCFSSNEEGGEKQGHAWGETDGRVVSKEWRRGTGVSNGWCWGCVEEVSLRGVGGGLRMGERAL